MNFRCDLLDAAIAEEVLKALQPAELELALAALRSWNRAIRPSCVSGRCGSNAPSMKPRSPSGAIRRSIPPSVWWRARWSGAGTMRCCSWKISKSKPRNFSVKKPASPPPSRRRKSWRWPGIYRGCGMPPPRRPRTASGCCGCSSRILRSRNRPNQKQLLVHIRWQGGACTDLSVQLPPNIADRVRYPAAVVDRVRDLAHRLTRCADRRTSSIEKDMPAPKVSRIR